MFLQFFYKLRKNGLDVSLNEWMTLMSALEKGLHKQSFTGFYHLARAIVVKSEVEFDKFDQTFVEVFKGVPYEGPVPDEVMKWLQNPKDTLNRDFYDDMMGEYKDQDFEELLRKMKETLEKQDGEHNGGTKWVGTQGKTGYGNSGWFPNGIRIGGEGMHRTAMSVATERNFRDFRTDKVLDNRQLTVAFRKLRSFSTDDPFAEKELDIDGTIEDTGNNAGVLKIRMKNPRKNAVKLILLMDSGGSMDWYSSMCNMLFHAATKSNFFKELHTFYFHNCIYDKVYKTPELFGKDSVTTDWLLDNFGSEYKVIIVSDAAMNPHELVERRYDWRTRSYDENTGLDRLYSLKDHFPYLIWLNPEPLPTQRNYWSQTHLELAGIFKMYDLSVDGLEKGIKSLMARR
ncbi:MAG: VWA domain-containing protein [Clostridiales bacterium]|nr:VWA domain-containing protein [Clostridiales bacterium]